MDLKIGGCGSIYAFSTHTFRNSLKRFIGSMISNKLRTSIITNQTGGRGTIRKVTASISPLFPSLREYL